MNSAYVKPVNEIFARYRLSSCQQDLGETLEHFLQDATAAECKEAAIRDAFMAGLRSSHIRQRLLEDNQLQLNNVFDKARSLHEARKNAECYSAGSSAEGIASVSSTDVAVAFDSNNKFSREIQGNCLTIKRENCGYCGG